MPLAIAGMPALVVPNAASTSNAITNFDDAWALSIYSPGTLTSTTINITVEPTSSGTAFVTLQSGGSDIVIAAGKATVLSPIPFKQLRLETNAAEGGARTFSVTKTMLL